MSEESFEARGFPVFACPFCGFEGIMSATQKCWDDKADLVLCPRCHTVTCVNSREIDLKQRRKRVTFQKWRDSDDDVPRTIEILSKVDRKK